MNINDLPQGSYTPVGGQPLNINSLPKGSYTPTATPQTPAAPQQSLSDQIWSGIAGAANFIKSNNLPGAQLGTALGNSFNSLGNAGSALLHGKGLAAADQALKVQPGEPTIGQVAGDAVQSIALPASLAITPTGATAAARIGDAALKFGAAGASQSGGASLAQGNNAVEALKAAAVGGATGAGLGAASQGAGELLSAGLDKLPNRLAKQALPKLDSGNIDYALKNTKVGSIPTLLNDSNSSISNLGEQVQTILNHPEYAADTGAGDFAVKKTLNAFPNSDYTPESVVATVKRLVPGQSQLVQKVADGTAVLKEKNALRSALDQVVKKAFTDAPDLTANKQIGLEFANALRGEVQSFAPETQPVFRNLTQEFGLNGALQNMADKLETKKALGLYDIVAALGGFTTGGPVGAAAMVATEKALRSPAVGLAAGKGVRAATPALKAAAGAARNVAIPGIQRTTSQ